MIACFVIVLEGALVVSTKVVGTLLVHLSMIEVKKLP
jgi:hypothetical protein